MTTTTTDRRPRRARTVDPLTDARRRVDRGIDAKAAAIVALGAADEELAAAEADLARMEQERRTMLAEQMRATLKVGR